MKAVLDAQEGQNASFFAPLHSSKEWTQINERTYYVIKAETHCHPSAISPFPGAATGVSYLFQPFVPLFVVLGGWKPFPPPETYLLTLEPSKRRKTDSESIQSGGEIRDEGAVGRGSRPKAGLTGFSVSTLLIPGFHQPWELEDVSKPGHIASGLDIMLEGSHIFLYHEMRY